MARLERRAFTLIELLVVVGVIAIVAAIMMPVFAAASLRAKVTRVHSDLRQVGIAINAYSTDCGGLPPVRSCCSGSSRLDYYEIPHELASMRYLATYRMYDPFNLTPGEDLQRGRTYKYVAINWGYSDGKKSFFNMWIPRDYPVSREDNLLYYRQRGEFYVFDRGKTYPKKPPITWGVWSVGPDGDPGLQETGSRALPVPRSQWYPFSKGGIITLLSDGRRSP